jgi:hypothetical protein
MTFSDSFLTILFYNQQDTGMENLSCRMKVTFGNYNTKLGASFPVLILLRYYKNMVYEDYLFVLSLTADQHFFSFVVVSLHNMP